MIIKLPSGGYQLLSKKSRKNLGKFKTIGEAMRREKQIQYFKRKK